MKLFEDLPSTNGPITAENLNQIQDNLVVVSGTEPTGNNREKVWIKKGKNLLNPQKYIYQRYIYADKTTLDGYENGLATDWIEVMPNTTYTLSGGNRCRYQLKSAEEVITFGGGDATTGKITFTTLADTKYVRFAVYDYYNASITYPSLPNVQLEQNSTATAYEKYVEPKIYVKNDNDVYEEFIKRQRVDILFQGNTNSDVNLSAAPSNYDYIEIYGYRGDYPLYEKLKIGKKNFSLCDNRITDGGLYTYVKEFTVSESTLVVERSKSIWSNGGTNFSINDDTAIYVTEVIGYKK